MKLLVLAFSTLLMPLTWSLSNAPSLSAASAAQLMNPQGKNQWLKASQNYTPVRGTRVSLIKPQGFTEAQNFSGFRQNDTGSAIIVTEIPAPYSQVAPGFTPENLKARGMYLIGQKKLTIDGHSGQLLQVTQVAYLKTFIKWIVVFGDETETITIVASLPQEMKNALSEPLKTAILSAKWQKDRVLDPLADINFAVDVTPDLKFTRRVQNILLYTKDGVIPVKSPVDPFFLVGQAISDIEVSNPKQYSENRLAQTEQINKLKINTSNPIKIDGLSGYEIVATANDVESNTPLFVYHVMLFDKKTYYIIQGFVGSQLKMEYWDDFKTMASSFKRK